MEQCVGNCTLLALPQLWLRGLGGKDKCVQCALALEFFSCVGNFFCFFS
jgi:hypothetical protein